MKIKKNKSLKQYNTFGLEVKARYFVQINSVNELIGLLREKPKSDIFVLGGGSNILLTKDLDKLVLHINLKGKKIINSSKKYTQIEVMAGENWHELVLWTLENNLGGLENLSLIPGNVGTSPIQNIGAYGVELKDVFKNCEAVDLKTMELKTFDKKDCKFGYRNSIFKNEAKGKYIITKVVLQLTNAPHKVKTSYGAIEKALLKENISKPGIRDVSNAVIQIRQEKLPDPDKLGNSGSFFKNPIISNSQFVILQKSHPDIPYYRIDKKQVKIPAGWLIESCGFKGKRYGDAGVHKNQALVLVNYGNATGVELLELAQKIRKEVKNTFNIIIDPEVNVM